MGELRLRAEIFVMSLVMRLPRPLKRVLAGRPRRLDGLELHPDVQLMLRLQKLSGQPDMATLPLPQARTAMVNGARTVGGRPPVAAYRDLQVDGASGPLRARLYTPAACLGRDASPTALYLHGGGWALGDLESHDSACRVMAEASGVQLLSVEYRLAPEDPYPAGLDDARAAYRWLVEHHASVGADPDLLAVSGDSAGGWLATNVAVTAAEEGLPLALQHLIYPGVDTDPGTRSRELFAPEGLILTQEFLDLAMRSHFTGTDPDDPVISPLRRTDWPDGLAPAVVITAGFDPLRDEGEAYADLLRRQGVEVEAVRFPTLIHGFLHMTDLGGDVPREVATVGRLLREGLGLPPL
ncbi:alpha/beta hydrolase [Nocardioides marmoraquaticus]